MDLHESFNNLCLSNISSTSFDDLLEELVLDIFSRLPAKTLVQSTSVSKKWYSIINTPSFISTHFSRSISDPSKYYIYIFREDPPSLAVFSSYNHALICHPNVNIPFETLSGTHETIGACNGLVCLTDYKPEYFGRDIYLFNPFIHKYKKIGVESSCYFDLIGQIDEDIYSGSRIGVYFGYSEGENDYKVVRILYLCIKQPNDNDSEPKEITKVEIYSLKTGKWKVTLEALADKIQYDSGFIVFVNDCLYWLTFPENSLLCFNLKEQVFSNIQMPPAYLMLVRSQYFFKALIKDGSVALYTKSSCSSSNNDTYFLFVMEKDIDGHDVQWKELSYVSPESSVNYEHIGFNSSGRLMFVRRHGPDFFFETVLFAVDFENSCPIEKYEVDITDFSDGVIVMESLVLLLD